MKFKQNLNLIIKYKSLQTSKRKEILHKFIIKIIKTTLGCLKLMSYISCKCYLIMQEGRKSSYGPDSTWNFGGSFSLLDAIVTYYWNNKKKTTIRNNGILWLYWKSYNFIKWSVFKILGQICLLLCICVCLQTYNRKMSVTLSSRENLS